MSEETARAWMRRGRSWSKATVSSYNSVFVLQLYDDVVCYRVIIESGLF